MKVFTSLQNIAILLSIGWRHTHYQWP